jgi:hypothetical protein
MNFHSFANGVVENRPAAVSGRLTVSAAWKESLLIRRDATLILRRASVLAVHLVGAIHELPLRRDFARFGPGRF